MFKEIMTKEFWDSHCYSIGLLPDDYNLEFYFKNKKYKIVGINPRRYKYPIITVQEKGPPKYEHPFWSESIHMFYHSTEQIITASKIRKMKEILS